MGANYGGRGTRVTSPTGTQWTTGVNTRDASGGLNRGVALPQVPQTPAPTQLNPQSSGYGGGSQQTPSQAGPTPTPYNPATATWGSVGGLGGGSSSQGGSGTSWTNTTSNPNPTSYPGGVPPSQTQTASTNPTLDPYAGSGAGTFQGNPAGYGGNPATATTPATTSTPAPTNDIATGNGTPVGAGNGTVSQTPPVTSEQLMAALQANTTPATWAGSQDIFGAQGVGQQNYYVPNTSTTGHGMDQGLVQALINNYGPQQAQQILARDMNADSPAARVAQMVRDQQTAQSSLPSMFNDLRNVPQLYANPATRALLPANIRAAEEARLNGGPDWRIASFGDAIDGNNVTRAVSPDSFVAPRTELPAPSQAQRQQNMVADFINSWLPHRNDPGARGLSQSYNVDQLNSAIASSPAQMQSVLANRLTGLSPQQLQVALTTSGLTLPQFLSQAVARLAA